MKIEFFTLNEEIVVVEDGKQKQITNELIFELFDKIKNDFPKSYEALEKEYEKAKLNRLYYKRLVVTRFIKCNFGTLDTTRYDIEGQQYNTEKVTCPLRGECKLEGIVCLANSLEQKISKREFEIVRLSQKGLTAKEIAEILFISYETVNKHIQKLLEKTDKKNMKQVISEL